MCTKTAAAANTHDADILFSILLLLSIAVIVRLGAAQSVPDPPPVNQLASDDFSLQAKQSATPEKPKGTEAEKPATADNAEMANRVRQEFLHAWEGYKN